MIADSGLLSRRTHSVAPQIWFGGSPSASAAAAKASAASATKNGARTSCLLYTCPAPEVPAA
jgi:hypothetical protein